MPLIYITGPPGVGKSTVIEELQSMGYIAQDADNYLCAWYDNKTGQIVDYPKELSKGQAEWHNGHTFKFSEDLIRKLSDESRGKTIFICGNAPANDLEMAKKYFDEVLCLNTDISTMVHRIMTRETFYGKDPEVLENLKDTFRAVIDSYKNYGAIMIDANQPIKQVVDEILTKLNYK